VYEISLSAADVGACRAVVGELAARFRSVEDPELLQVSATYAHELPRTLRAGLNDFRLREPSGACVIGGFPVDDDAIGATPANWGAQAQPSSTLEPELFFLLCGSLLGDPFGWATQQDSRIMHDILPIRGHEEMQLNSASTSTIFWHVEDAFHPYRAEYVGMMCLRNVDRTPTTFASIDDLDLPGHVVEVLFQPRFPIRPDESHRIRLNEQPGDGTAALRERSYQRIQRMAEEPPRIAVLFGDPASPYLRLDPYFMEDTPDDPEATAAMEALSAAIDKVLDGVALQPGQVLFVDNFRAVHGRRPFTARYDGRDRWLKRLNVTRDLRKSRDARARAESRVVY
jgi:enduracididine beta-hydroxylase